MTTAPTPSNPSLSPTTDPPPATAIAPHNRVPHPREFLAAEATLFSRINRALTTTLGSNAVFLACFIIPLLAVPASNTVKLIVGIVFSNWFQAWALPVLQKGQAQADLRHEAKADADHVALTSVHTTVDAVQAINTRQDDRLTRIEHHLSVLAAPTIEGGE